MLCRALRPVGHFQEGKHPLVWLLRECGVKSSVRLEAPTTDEGRTNASRSRNFPMEVKDEIEFKICQHTYCLGNHLVINFNQWCALLSDAPLLRKIRRK